MSRKLIVVVSGVAVAATSLVLMSRPDREIGAPVARPPVGSGPSASAAPSEPIPSGLISPTAERTPSRKPAPQDFWAFGGGRDPDERSFEPSISADGRFVAFTSAAGNLVSSGKGEHAAVFVRDGLTGRTVVASVSGSGRAANGPSSSPAISADGRFVAFLSSASNLTPGDTNGVADVFVRDLRRRTTERVSVSSDGLQADRAVLPDSISISADGRFVAFSSGAANLVRRDRNGVADIFVRDRAKDRTELVSLSSEGARSDGESSRPAISEDGRWVAFRSYATTLVSEAGEERCTPEPGRRTTSCADLFLRDRARGTTVLVSEGLGGAQAHGHAHEAAISGNGRYVAFLSSGTHVEDDQPEHPGAVYLLDTKEGTTRRVARTDQREAQWGSLAVSGNGRYIAFVTDAQDLVAGDDNTCYVGQNNDRVACADAFVYDVTRRSLRLVSRSSDGSPSDSASFQVRISRDGRYAVFSSAATNLSPKPHHACAEWENCPDVFVRDIKERKTALVSHAMP